MKDFSDRQIVLIRERLILYWRNRRQWHAGRASIRAVIDDILLSEATSYESPLDGADTGPTAPLKYTNVRTFLLRQRRNISVNDLDQFHLFLLDVGLLTDEDMDAQKSESSFNLPIGGTIRYFRQDYVETILKALEGEYLTQEQGNGQCVIEHLLIFNIAEPQATALEKRETKYKKASFEKDDEFAQRVDRVNYDVIIDFVGQALATTENSIIIVQMPKHIHENKFELETMVAEFSGGNLICHKLSAQKIYEKVSNLEKLTSRLKGHLILSRKNIIPFFSKTLSLPISSILTNIFETDNENSAIMSVKPENIQELNVALLESAKTDDLEGMIKALVHGADINAQDPQTGFTASHWAANNGSHEAYAVLAHDPDVTPELEAEYLPEFDDPEWAKERWQQAMAQLDPLQRDQEGLLPAMRVSVQWSAAMPPEEQAKQALFEKLVGDASSAATSIGVNWVGFVLNAVPADQAPTLRNPDPAGVPAGPGADHP
jgi:hypothetical protein